MLSSNADLLVRFFVENTSRGGEEVGSNYPQDFYKIKDVFTLDNILFLGISGKEFCDALDEAVEKEYIRKNKEGDSLRLSKKARFSKKGEIYLPEALAFISEHPGFVSRFSSLVSRLSLTRV